MQLWKAYVGYIYQSTLFEINRKDSGFIQTMVLPTDLD